MLSSGICFAALGPNIISNPSLEMGSVGWGLRNGKIDSIVAHSGTRSLRLDGDKNNTWNITQTESLKGVLAGEYYILEVWCKAVGEGDDVCLLGLRALGDAGNTIVYDWKKIPIPYQDEWFLFRQEIRASTNPEATKFQLFCWAQSGFQGSIWFDDFSLRIIDDIFPYEPTALSARREGESIFLSWQAPQKASDGDVAQGGYNIYRSETPINKAEDGELVASGVKANYWEDTKVNRGKYYYIVTALDKVANESEASFPLEVLGAGSLSGKVRDEFGTPIEGALLFALDDGFEITTEADGSYFFQTLLEGTQKIRVVKPGYPWIEEDVEIELGGITTLNFKMASDTTKPLAPIADSIDNATVGMVTISWKAPTNLGDKKIAGYNIYRTESPTVVAHPDYLIKSSLNAEVWSDVKVVPGQRYWYAITLIDTAFNESPLSNVLDGFALAPPRPTLTAPALRAKIIDQPIEFQWSELADVAYYRIEISKDELFPKEATLLISNLETNSYTYKRMIRYQEGSARKVAEIGLPDGQWFWRVQAYYKNGVVSSPSDHLVLQSINTKFWVDEVAPGEMDIGKKTTGLSSLEIPFFQAFPAVLTHDAPEIKFEFYINYTEPVEGELLIIDPSGRVVATLFTGVFTPGQLLQVPWRGLDNKQRQVRNGLYIAQLRINAGNQKKISNIKFLVFN